MDNKPNNDKVVYVAIIAVIAVILTAVVVIGVVLAGLLCCKKTQYPNYTASVNNYEVKDYDISAAGERNNLWKKF